MDGRIKATLSGLALCAFLAGIERAERLAVSVPDGGDAPAAGESQPQPCLPGL